MSKLILFSTPEPSVISSIVAELFPQNFTNKNLAYMPADGAVNKKKYTNFWGDLAAENNFRLHYINNSLTGEAAAKEVDKMHKCSVLLISGGNTYHLLRNIKRNKMDEAIIEFAKNKDKVVAGFSAGALILTPRIDNIEIDDYDENIVGLKDLSALGLVSYEVFPHYSSEYKSAIDEYLNENPGVEVKTIRDEEFIIDKC